MARTAQPTRRRRRRRSFMKRARSSIRRVYSRGSARKGVMSGGNGDGMVRAVANVQRGAILLGDPISDTVTAFQTNQNDIGAAIKAAATKVAQIPPSRYIQCNVPVIAAETGIGVKNLAKRFLSGLFR